MRFKKEKSLPMNMNQNHNHSVLQTVSERYLDLVNKAALQFDQRQSAVADLLGRRLQEIVSAQQAASKNPRSFSFSHLFRFSQKHPSLKNSVKGLYIYGSVGSGKTMLMDLFFELLPHPQKRRVHFHDFLREAQDLIQHRRCEQSSQKFCDTDPVGSAVRLLLQKTRVLCLDEFSVTQIADAMILARLFQEIFSQGIFLFVTSNVPPNALYADGPNRARVLPFIEKLLQHMEVVSLVSDKDYRLSKTQKQQVYFAPLGRAASEAMEAVWHAIIGEAHARSEMLSLKGRTLKIPWAVGRAARFHFSDLCEAPLGACDFAAIAEHYSTVLIDQVPVLPEQKRNEIKRFILLIDVFYDRGTTLIMSADSTPENLYQGRVGTEAFEFRRTASRLTEMQSEAWVSRNQSLRLEDAS